jgi:poly-gamma-glutamate capsule biosynthesis protein CapA/YwtB (metallophosphatase superfamily)
MRNGLVTMFLCGDVMTGRGVDQILPHPGDPQLWESYTRDARVYVRLAEGANGAIPSPVDFSWPWGDALAVLAEVAPDVRVLNLETSITRSDDVAGGKAVHYRMTPENIGCLTVARPDACTLANNHVLDFGYRGLADTRTSLVGAGISPTGAGRDIGEAGRPAVAPVRGGGRLVVCSAGACSSGIPDDWAATPHRAGVNLTPDQPGPAVDALAQRMVAAKAPGDVLVASIHWGPNWGYPVRRDHSDFAHRLIDLGVDVIHGHSSHHPRPIEVYRGRLILYGCGDFIDDYEGIGGHGEFRDDLRLLYFVSVDPATGRLARLRIAPMQSRRMRLQHAAEHDRDELRRLLSRISHDFGSQFDRAADGMLELRMDGGAH